MSLDVFEIFLLLQAQIPKHSQTVNSLFVIAKNIRAYYSNPCERYF